jgi:hypothetical protein
VKSSAWLGFVLLLVGVAGCFDKVAATSGQVGCAPNEVEIADEENTGYGSQTWTATCHGEQYYCSRVDTGKETSQVSCHAASSPVPAGPASPIAATPAKSVEPPAAAANEGSTPAAQAPPTAVAGFTFDSTLAEASSACTEKGYLWQPGAQDHFSCSGTPTSIGIAAVPTLRFCEEKLCAVSLQVASPNAWLAAFGNFNQALTKKYGRPGHSQGELRSNCSTEKEFEACIMTSKLRLVREWRWDAGATISLRLAAGEDAPEMKLIYVRHDQAQRERHEPVPDAL